MKIQVLGSGCPSCRQLFEKTKKIAEELSIKEEIEYSTDITKIISLGLMTSPVLVIDNKPVLFKGEKSEKEIKDALQNYLTY